MTDVGEALRDLVPEPPRTLTMAGLTAARSVRRRQQAVVAAVVLLAVLAAVVPVAVVSLRLAAAPTAARATPPGPTVISVDLGHLSVTYPSGWLATRPARGVELILSVGCAGSCPDQVVARFSVAPPPVRPGVPRSGPGVTELADGELDACPFRAADVHPRFDVRTVRGVVRIDACAAGPDPVRLRRELSAVAASVRLDQ